MAIDTIKASAILDGAIDSADLADSAVTSAKIDSTSTGMTFADLTVDTNTLVVDEINNRVGIGTNAPSSPLEIAYNTDINMNADGTGHLQIYGDAYNFGIALNADGANIYTNSGSRSLIFGVNETEFMRLNPAGDLMLGTTTNGVQNADCVYMDTSIGRNYFNTTSTSGTIFCNQSYADTALRYQIIFYRSETQVGSIRSDSTSTTYYTTSDYRLKENLNAISDGIDRVKQLNPLRFNFIAKPEKTVDGFLAHEVDSIVPEAIAGEKDAVDEDGNIDPQQIDHARLVPLLTAALKESIAKIEALEARVTALESA